MAHFSQGLGFDLTDAFTRDLELPTDFLKRSTVAILESEAQGQYVPFAFGQAVQNV